MKNTGMGRFGLVFLALALCLAGTGAAFAQWCDSVEVVGVVETGTVKIGIYDYGTLDDGVGDNGVDHQAPFLGEDSIQPIHFNNSEGKDVAKHTSSNEGREVCLKDIKSPPGVTGIIEGASFRTKVVETVDNAYPGYLSGSWVYLGNCGTIPVKIEEIKIESVSGDVAPFLMLGCWEVWTVKDGAWVSAGSGNAAAGQIIDGTLGGIQLHECEYCMVYFEFFFIEDGADGSVMPQNSRMKAEVSVTACQWNESKWNDVT